MIVDVHSHYYRYPDHFTESFLHQSRRARNGLEVDLTVRWEQYARTAGDCRKTVVFGAKARMSGIWVPDREVAAYAAAQPDRLIPFLLSPVPALPFPDARSGIGSLEQDSVRNGLPLHDGRVQPGRYPVRE